MKFKEIQKIKKFKRIGIKKVSKEISEISDLLGSPQVQYSRYHIHKVLVDRIDYFAADAITLSKYDQQRGRGCWRHLFYTDTREYVGVAKEQDSGGYRIMARI